MVGTAGALASQEPGDESGPRPIELPFVEAPRARRDFIISNPNADFDAAEMRKQNGGFEAVMERAAEVKVVAAAALEAVAVPGQQYLDPGHEGKRRPDVSACVKVRETVAATAP